MQDSPQHRTDLTQTLNPFKIMRVYFPAFPVGEHQLCLSPDDPILPFVVPCLLSALSSWEPRCRQQSPSWGWVQPSSPAGGERCLAAWGGPWFSPWPRCWWCDPKHGCSLQLFLVFPSVGKVYKMGTAFVSLHLVERVRESLILGPCKSINFFQ